MSVMVSGLTLKSLIDFEFILSGVRKLSSFIFLHVIYRVLPVPLTEETVFTPLYFLLCHGLVDHIDMGLFLGSPFYSSDLCVCIYTSKNAVLITIAL